MTSLVMGLLLFHSSPLLNLISGDSSIFMTAGRGILHGKLLYVDLFDNKGPVIFLIEAVTQWIHDGLLSVWVLELLCMFLSLFTLYQTVRMVTGRALSFFVMLCYISYTIWLIEGGNITEVYSNPFSILALYFMTRVFTGEAARVKPWYGFWLGVGFALLVLMRATNAVVIVGVTAVLAVFLLLQKEYKTLFLNMGTFLGGAALVILPLCIYFIAHGAFYDFLYGTFLFNVLYSGEGTWHTLLQKPKFMLWLAAMVAAGVAGGVCCLAGKGKTLRERVFGGGMVGIALITGYAVCMSKLAFPHYLLIGAPVFALGLAMVCRRLAPYLSAHRWMRAAAVVLAAVLLIRGAGYWTWYTYRYAADSKPVQDAAAAQSAALGSQIPHEDRDSVWAYNVEANWYFYNRIDPCFRNYALQDWMSVSDPAITDNILAMLEEAPPKWVVTLNQEPFGKQEVMQKILEKYELAAQNENERLYRRR